MAPPVHDPRTSTRPATALPRGLVGRVVVPIGGSDSEYLVQQQAVEFAAVLEAPVLGIHVTTAPDEAAVDLFRYLEGLCEKWGVPCETQTLAHDDVAEALRRELDAGDLCFIGTAHLGNGYYVSSVAEALIRHAPCPVQVMRIQD